MRGGQITWHTYVRQNQKIRGVLLKLNLTKDSDRHMAHVREGERMKVKEMLMPSHVTAGTSTAVGLWWPFQTTVEEIIGICLCFRNEERLKGVSSKLKQLDLKK